MLVNFFKMNNEPCKEFSSKEDFYAFLENSKDLRNYLFRPDELSPIDKYKKFKIIDTKFTNVSFSKTVIKRLIFLNCLFDDCLFIGSKIDNCEFHNCKFTNTNPYKIEFSEVYIDPKSFEKTFPGNRVDKSNIAVHLYSQLKINSENLGQSNFIRTANYHFKKWDNRLLRSKYFNQMPYSIGHFDFWLYYPFNKLYQYFFGYGLRLRNFIITFLLTFTTFFFINKSNWESYGLKEKDVLIDSFNPDTVNIKSNLLYTLDITTKLVDSQIQPTSNIGMLWLAIQSVFAFILLTGLITILINKFVR